MRSDFLLVLLAGAVVFLVAVALPQQRKPSAANRLARERGAPGGFHHGNRRTPWRRSGGRSKRAPLGLELDVHMTRDGVVVVIHDDTVDRTTDSRGPVREKYLSEIKTLDAGHRFSRD